MGLAPAPPAAQGHGAIELIVVVDPQQAAPSGRGDRVAPGEGGDREVGPFTGAAAVEAGVEYVTAVLDHDQAVGVGQLPDAVPVGDVADEVRGEDRPAPVRHHGFDAVGVDLVRGGVDVDEGGHDAGVHERGHVGAEGEGGGDDLVARLELEQVDRQAQGR